MKDIITQAKLIEVLLKKATDSTRQLTKNIYVKGNQLLASNGSIYVKITVETNNLNKLEEGVFNGEKDNLGKYVNVNRNGSKFIENNFDKINAVTAKEFGELKNNISINFKYLGDVEDIIKTLFSGKFHAVKIGQYKEMLLLQVEKDGFKLEAGIMPIRTDTLKDKFEKEKSKQSC